MILKILKIWFLDSRFLVFFSDAVALLAQTQLFSLKFCALSPQKFLANQNGTSKQLSQSSDTVA